ncbi:MAG: tetratricopeptide repeat protein [Candidatus Heimdallarchaeaceae archaeon]|jgi:tetratricopeptide (TPR) repeat protein
MTSSILKRINALFLKNNYSEVVDLFIENIDMISDLEDKMKLYHLAAKSYYHLGRNEEAFDCIQKVKNNLTEPISSHKENIEVYLDYAKILRRIGQRKNAKAVYQEIIKNYKIHLDDELNATILHNLANIHLELGDFDRSKDYFHQALEIDKKTDNHKGLSLTYSGLGSLSFYLGQFEEAIEYYQKSLEFRKKTNDHIGEALILLNIGSSYSNILNQKKADKYLDEYLKIFHQYNHERGIQEVHITRARMNFNLNNYPLVVESLKFLEESEAVILNKEQIELVNILIESLLRNEELVRAEKLIERSITPLEKAELEIDSSLYEEYGKLKQLLSLIKFQLDKVEETLQVLEELEEFASSHNDFQSLVVVFFSKANVYYQIDSMDDALLFAKKAETIAKRIQHSSLPLILDILFRINVRIGYFSECIKLLKQLKRISVSDSSIIELAIKSFQIFANEKTKIMSKKSLHETDIFQLPITVLQFIVEGILHQSLKFSKILEFKSVTQDLKNNRASILIPYFLQASFLLDEEHSEMDFSNDIFENDCLETIYSNVLLKKISSKKLKEIISNWNDQEEFTLHQSLICLDTIFYGVLYDLISKENLKLDFWGQNITDEYKDIVKVKQELLIKIVDIKNPEDFSYESKTPMGCMVSAIYKNILLKIYEIEGITQKKLKTLLVLLSELIIRTLVMLFIR